jgi:hypothetical protein
MITYFNGTALDKPFVTAVGTALLGGIFEALVYGSLINSSWPCSSSD